MRHDFAIDRIGDTDGGIERDQAEVADILVVAVREVGTDRAAEKGFNHAAHAVFLQLVRELVEMHDTV